MSLLRPSAAVLTFLAIISFGCSEKNAVEARSGDSGVTIYKIRGIVRGMDEQTSTMTVEHEEVPGFMPAMTMPFTAKDPKILSGIKVGDAIAFSLAVTSDDSWIQEIRPIEAATLRVPARSGASQQSLSKARRLKEGDAMPAFQLIDQQGRPITRDTFSGKTLLLTYIFTRCPVPNFCPLISRNFEQIATEIQKDSTLADRVRLLSISFDPEFDTPEVLARYGNAFTEDGDQWRFATGQPAEIEKLTHAFSVYVQAEDGTINHGLCTALVGLDGTIKKIWRGNAWRPEEVLAELSAGSAPPANSAIDLDPDQGNHHATNHN